MKIWRRVVLVAGVFGAWVCDSEAAEARKPWSLARALEMPEWVNVSGTHRTRYETLDEPFRAGRMGGDQMLAFRTTVRLDLRSEAVGVSGELIDSRQELADAGTPLDTSMVNTLELLQAYGSLRWPDLFAAGSQSELRVGRQTLDIGSRRLVARNSFRNTINSFTGAHGSWQAENGPGIRAFYVLPLNRQPADGPSLLENEVELDDESFDVQFWGIHARWPKLMFGAVGEAYVYGLDEEDSRDRPTRNRELYTPGLRLARRPAPGAWDFDLESVVQFGKTRGSTDAADTTRLDHFAHFHHAEAGYTFQQAWTPRAAVMFDYASGDDRPDDDESNRFDTLYGARRFDHGPTGIWGAFARSNIQSPGYSLGVEPARHVEAELKHRFYWLAADRDAWTTSGLRDSTGRAGSFIGQQVEVMVRWDIVPGNLRLEVGGAHLFAGRFVEDAPNSAGKGDSTCGYATIEVRF